MLFELSHIHNMNTFSQEDTNAHYTVRPFTFTAMFNNADKNDGTLKVLLLDSSGKLAHDVV